VALYGYKINNIALTGGEPTMRDDLPKLVREIKYGFPGLSITLVTNGIKLANENYLKELCDSGVDVVMLSLNGLNVDTYNYTNPYDMDILSIKKKVLDNLSKYKVRTIMSPMIVKGVNEDDLHDLFNYAFLHLDFVYEMRIRGACNLGRHENVDAPYLSELFDITAKAIGKNRNFFLKKVREDSFHSILGLSCTLIIDKGKIVECINGEYSKYGIYDIFALLRVILRYLPRVESSKRWEVIEFFLKKVILQDISHDLMCSKDNFTSFLNMLWLNMLIVRIWRWLDPTVFDFNETKTGGGLQMLYDGEIVDLCASLNMIDEL
jgi:MoaA/NifB/PqqE/SkfB family radical SAM enzyme